MNKDDENPSWHPPDASTVEGIHGAITDSSSLFTPDKGSTGKEFWTNVSNTEAAAVFAVVGTPFDRNATFDTLMLSGEPEAAIIVDKLLLSKESRVLEIGVGVARIAYHVTRSCGHFVGADITRNMLEISRKNLEGRTNFELHELSEAGPLPFADETFDAVYSQAVFIHLDREDAYRYIRESFRVLKPGGRAYFQFYNLLQDEGFELFDWVSRYACTSEGKVRGRIQFVTNVEAREYMTRPGFAVDERDSHLEAREQHYPFPIPMLNYDYYLIAVGEKPGTGARLLTKSERPGVARFSDDYFRHYMAGFKEKVDRFAGGLADPINRYLATLDPLLAFRVVHEVERGAKVCERRGLSPIVFAHPVMDAIGADDSEGDLALRVRKGIRRALGQALD